MIDRWQKQLVVSNVSVFLAVLSLFCGTVYWFGCSSYDAQLRDKLRSIADSAISSIDFDDYGQSHNGKPDLIVSELPDEASPSLVSMRLQWFTAEGKPDIEKGSMSLSVPFIKQEGYQTQASPPAFVFTKPAISEGKLLGYVRVGHPLTELQHQKEMLLQCLAFGALIAILASGIGVFFLIRQSLTPIKENIKQLKQFSADAAHELKTPITAIHTNSTVALRHSEGMRDSDRIKFQDIVSGSQQMQKLTEDLLTLAKAEQIVDSKNTSLTKSVSLKKAIQAVFSRVEDKAQEKDLLLENKVSDNLFVLIEQEDLDCILNNVIDNAIKYTQAKGSIILSAEAINSSIKLTVEDTGIGIAPADLEQIFERFWRADKVRTHTSNGNGLGLPIVRAILEKNEGSIHVSSELDHGTTFHLNMKGERSSSKSGDKP